jgi:hypothetical protein
MSSGHAITALIRLVAWIVLALLSSIVGTDLRGMTRLNTDSKERAGHYASRLVRHVRRPDEHAMGVSIANPVDIDTSRRTGEAT